MKEFIIEIAKEAGNIALKYLGKVSPTYKGYKNIVTEADKVVEEFITTKIKEKYPDHNIVAEENDYKKTDSTFTWFIDPIDGTTNYSHGDPHFAVSIACAENDELKYACVFIPMMDELYYAEKDKGAELNNKKIKVSGTSELSKSILQFGLSPVKYNESIKVIKYFTPKVDRMRDYGFCAGQLCYIATGRADILIKNSQSVWDFAAGVLIVEEAGGKVTDVEGNKLDLNNKKSSLIVSNNILHNEMLEHFKSNDLKNLDRDSWW